MAHCVISEIYDTARRRMVPACVVHIAYAPCPFEGKPARTTPLEIWDNCGRDEALAFWHERTHGQRSLALHHGAPDDDREHQGPDCWCRPERIEAKP